MPKPKDNCCIAPEQLREIHVENLFAPNPVLGYAVPAGKVFVLTAWTLLPPDPSYPAPWAWMLRDGVRVAFSAVTDLQRTHHHLLYPTGIRFPGGAVLAFEFLNGTSGKHLLYGYEVDA